MSLTVKIHNCLNYFRNVYTTKHFLPADKTKVVEISVPPQRKMYSVRTSSDAKPIAALNVVERTFRAFKHIQGHFLPYEDSLLAVRHLHHICYR